MWAVDFIKFWLRAHRVGVIDSINRSCIPIVHMSRSSPRIGPPISYLCIRKMFRNQRTEETNSSNNISYLTGTPWFDGELATLILRLSVVPSRLKIAFHNAMVQDLISMAFKFKTEKELIILMSTRLSLLLNLRLYIKEMPWNDIRKSLLQLNLWTTDILYSLKCSLGSCNIS